MPSILTDISAGVVAVLVSNVVNVIASKFSKQMTRGFYTGDKIPQTISKIINRNGTNMFLGCQKIDYHTKHCNTDPNEKGIWEALTVVGNTSSCSCRTRIDYPKLRMEEYKIPWTLKFNQFYGERNSKTQNYLVMSRIK